MDLFFLIIDLTKISKYKFYLDKRIKSKINFHSFFLFNYSQLLGNSLKFNFFPNLIIYYKFFK